MVRKNHKRYAIGLIGFLLLYLFTVRIGVEYFGTISFGSVILANLLSMVSEEVAFAAKTRSLQYVPLLLPAVFLISALFSNTSRWTSRLARVAKYLAIICSVITVLDLAPLAFASGPAFNVSILILFSGFFLQILVFSLARQLVKAPDNSLRITPQGSIACASVLFVILFSVTSSIAVVIQTLRIADGHPYCIAMADTDKITRRSSPYGYGTIRNWEILRGSRFSTTKTGYKSTSKWYYHAVLIVGRQSGEREYWNWSISRLNFHKIQRPDLKIATPINGCQVRDSFFSKLPLI